MRIATYNIWNCDVNFDYRIELLCKEIDENKIDIIALQEVRNKKIVEYIKRKCKYDYFCFKKYYDCEEGLAVLSRFPIIYSKTNWENSQDIHNSGILRTVIDCDDLKLGITDVHLDWKSALNREIEIVKTIRLIDEDDCNDYEMLMGDFNSYPDSSIHRFLTGKQSLNNCAANWNDFGELYSVMSKHEPEVTLDFFNNPRWRNENVVEIPGRFDWILLKYPYPKESPKLNFLKIIGNKEDENYLTPSDHYGVLCDIDF